MTPEQIAQIEKIVEDILQAETTNLQKSNKNLLVIIGATQIPLDNVLQQLELCMKDGWKVRIILSELATKTINLDSIHSVFGEKGIIHENELTDIPSIVDSSTQIVLPALAYPMAGKLALKLVDTPCTYLVFHALCQGKQVIAASHVSCPKNSYFDKKTTALDQIDPAHVNTLTEFGVKWIPIVKITETIRDLNGLTREIIQQPIISASVIGHLTSDVREIVYTKPSIITPLAREHALKRGIRFILKS